jgi:hypothetical protein
MVSATAVIEEGDWSMSLSASSSLRKEVQDYIRSCEHLLSAVIMPSKPLSQDELLVVQYYTAEVIKILPTVESVPVDSL